VLLGQLDAPVAQRASGSPLRHLQAPVIANCSPSGSPWWPLPRLLPAAHGCRSPPCSPQLTVAAPHPAPCSSRWQLTILQFIQNADQTSTSCIGPCSNKPTRCSTPGCASVIARLAFINLLVTVLVIAPLVQHRINSEAAWERMNI
jgi:hypothetical protein